MAFQPPPMARPRRSSSIHEPSPLARLFLGSPDETGIVNRLRDRRMSLVNAVSSSQSQPALSSILSPVRSRAKRFNQEIPQQRANPPPEPRQRLTHLSRPSIVRIEEGKKLSFLGRDDSPSRNREAIPGKANVPFPRRNDAEREEHIGKASQVEEMLAQKQDDESIGDRLAGIDARQRRIEELLEKLVRAKEKVGEGTDDLDDH